MEEVMDPSAAATHGKHIYNNEMIGSSRRHARTLPPNEEEYEANKVLNNSIDLPENQRTHYIYNRSIINVRTHNQLARIIYSFVVPVCIAGSETTTCM